MNQEKWNIRDRSKKLEKWLVLCSHKPEINNMHIFNVVQV